MSRIDSGEEVRVAVRDALLVLLLNGPAYGFQLHGELAARTGGRREVNVGQTYATLDRLTGRGLVESAGSTDDGLPLHRLTPAGRRAARAWLDGEDAAGADPWDETVDRVLVAASMRGIDAGAVVAAERRRWSDRRDGAAARAAASASEPDAAGARDAAIARLAHLAVAAELERAEAAMRWLVGVDVAPGGSVEFDPSIERPRRGRRPSRSPGAAAPAPAPLA